MSPALIERQPGPPPLEGVAVGDRTSPSSGGSIFKLNRKLMIIANESPPTKVHEKPKRKKFLVSTKNFFNLFKMSFRNQKQLFNY